MGVWPVARFLLEIRDEKTKTQFNEAKAWFQKP